MNVSTTRSPCASTSSRFSRHASEILVVLWCVVGTGGRRVGLFCEIKPSSSDTQTHFSRMAAKRASGKYVPPVKGLRPLGVMKTVMGQPPA